jgi:drug/metabolite transporter (DMT)-like permease
MENRVPILALLACCMIWGTTFVVVKDVSSKIDPFLLSALRNGIAVFVMLPTIFLLRKGKSLKDRNAIKNGAQLGALLAAIYVVQTVGLQTTTSTHSAFITCSAVIMVPIVLLVTGKQILTRQQMGSIIIVAIGLYYLTRFDGLANFNGGDLITFFGAIICAIQMIAAGHFVRKTDFIGLIFYQFLFASILSLAGILLQTGLFSQSISCENSALIGILYLGIMGTLFCFFVTVWAQKYVSTVSTAMIFSMEPVFASIASYLFLGEFITAVELGGAFCILVGLLMFNIPRKNLV